LIDEWINVQGGGHSTGWRIDILSRRIICWLSQAPFVLQDADARFYRRFIRSLSRQVRYLRHNINDSREGLPRLQAIIALNYATLCMQGQSGYLRGNVRRLIEELRKQVLPDGGHVSRNPGSLIELLADLLPLRQLFSARQLQPPQALNNAIDRTMPMLRFFRHGDGNFAQFNGMGPTPVDLLATVLAYDDARGTPVPNAQYSGYQRVDAGQTVLLMDSGPPPPMEMSQEAHAGCLAFELSWKQHRLVVNCGLPAVNKENWRQVARATPAHSTVTLNDRSSCRFLESLSIRQLFGARRSFPARATYALRENPAPRRYARRMTDTSAIAASCIRAPSGSPPTAARLTARTLLPGPTANRFPRTLRMNLRSASICIPAIKASRLADGRGVILLLHDRDLWTFATLADAVELEESVFWPAMTARGEPCKS
jgi:uncharacterized heparinase superfamily protein